MENRIETADATKGAFLTAPGWEGLADVFDGQLARGLHGAAQISVRLLGERVLERWGGSLDAGGRRPVGPRTPFMIFSATKALTAACIHKLADEGELDLEAPVAAYWPAFGAKGKNGVTVLHLLLHQAGVPARGTLSWILSFPFPGLAARRVAAMAPVHEPGTRVVYHAFTAGFVLGELIRRVSGLDAATYLERNFLGPLGMADSRAGLPWREYGRAARIRSADPEQRSVASIFSNPLYRGLFLPAASLNTTAHDLAIFYAMLASGGSFGGRRCLSEAAVARAAAMRWDGPDGESGRRARWAAGFGLGGYSPFPDRDLRHMGREATERTFGHSGQGGCAIGWADPDAGLAFAFTCDTFQPLEEAHARFEELADACRGADGVLRVLDGAAGTELPSLGSP